MVYYNSNVRRYKCDICSSGFKRRDHLERHKKIHAKGNIKIAHTQNIKQENHNIEEKANSEANDDKELSTTEPSSSSSHDGSKTHFLDVEETKVSFQCNVCDALYMTDYHLKRHMKFHVFSNEIGHIEEKSDTVKRYRCETCGSKFKSNYHLQRHTKSHKMAEERESGGTKCAVCKDFFGSKADFLQHMKTHMAEQDVTTEDISDIKTECEDPVDYCSNDPSKLKWQNDNHEDPHSNLNNDQTQEPDLVHIASLIEDTDVSIKTKNTEEETVSYEYYNSDDPEVVVVKMEKDEVKQIPLHFMEFVCDICQEQFSKKSSLVNHRKTHEGVPNEEDYLGCNFCGKIFETHRKLRIHKRIHDLKEFICETCHKEFRTKQSLELHKKIHLAIKEFECSTCQKQFRTKQHLLVHGRVHLKQKLVLANSEDMELAEKTELDNKYLTEVFQCEFCGKDFSSKQNMQLHLKIHYDIKDFVCEICDKGFRTKQQLNVHKNRHKDHISCKTVRFTCEFCQKVISTKQNLALHMKIHLDVKDFLCMVCGKGFRTKQQLKNHDKVHRSLKSKKKQLMKSSNDIDKSEKQVDDAECSGAAEDLLMEVCNIEQMLENRMSPSKDDTRIHATQSFDIF